MADESGDRPNRLRLHDTQSREVREVVPESGGELRFYCCGPTVYGAAHIGNFRTFVLQDVFRRVVEQAGLRTRHVRNVTDIDDKTIRSAREAGESLADFTSRWKDRFGDDCRRLGLLDPHVEPSAVGHIPQQIELIGRLKRAGAAYQGKDGSVYFRVSAFPEYGRLSHLDEREVRAGASGAIDADEYEKDSVADFALWKARKPEDGENFWPSPWGEGRPGWHLECSAMCREYLGDTFDLHSGGVDLIFPHHENEIAQSEMANRKPFARHWFHIAHLLVEGQKMSKSLGNLFTIEDLIAKGHAPPAIRLVLLQGHYRQPLNFTMASLDGAAKQLARWSEAMAALENAAGGDTASAPPRSGGAFRWFHAAWDALLSDLNTPRAIGAINRTLNEKGIPKDPGAAAEMLSELRALVRDALGLDIDAAESEAETAPAEVVAMAAQRQAARTAKDWPEADRLRDDITARGWTVKDTRDSFELEPRR